MYVIVGLVENRSTELSEGFPLGSLGKTGSILQGNGSLQKDSTGQYRTLQGPAQDMLKRPKL